MKNINIDYITKAKKLSEEDRDRLLSRMGGKLPKRLHKEKLTVEEAIAIQLELEDEQLQEWRANMVVIKEKAAKVKVKADEKAAKAKTKEVPANVTKPAAEPAATTKAPVIPASKK
jgi:hypothetical protein